MEELRLKKFMESDIEILTPIMTRAFDIDSQIHLNKPKGGPTGYDDGSFLRKWGLHHNATSYCVLCEKRIIGMFILWIHQNQHNSLGCIFVDPDYEDKGIGTRIWKKIESLYPDTITWTTETPMFSHRNHNFYVNKCGFHVVKIENPQDINEGMYVLKKYMKESNL